jgi:hypothetical protein
VTFRRTVVSALFALLSLGFASPARADVDLWPLLEVDHDTTTVLYPFYVHEGDFLMVFPVYYRTDEGHEHHVLWPLFKMRDGRVTRVAPIWYSSDPNKFWIFPLAYHDAKSTFLLVPPACFRGDELQAVLPLYVRSKSPDSDWLVVGPRLFGWHQTPDADHVFAGVLFDHVSRPNGSWDTSLVPIAWAFGGPDRRGLLVPPAYFERSSGRDVSAVLPLLWSSKTPDESHLWLAGYWRAHTPDSDSLAMYPFFSTKTSHQDTSELSILWPIYNRKQTVDQNGDVTRRHRRFLAFADDLTPQRRSLSLFGFVVRETTN